MTRVYHRDVGSEDRGPRAFCNGDEYAVCTEDWLHVTCEACHAKRHPQAPLSREEYSRCERAVGPGVTRKLTADEVAYDDKHRPPRYYR